jgi:N-formylglutamate deformylase
MNTPIFHFESGTAPLLVSIPHLGREIPDAERASMTDAATPLADTDWHLDQLYDFARELGASILHARISRYVIDLNRPPDDEDLYPGRTRSALCPTTTFRGEALYRAGAEPSAAEQARRLAVYWQPYHDQLAAELQRLKSRHGRALLWEGHSIASVLPRLFEGKLPDLNIGTADGHSCSLAVQQAVRDQVQDCGYTWALNGRYKGGYITRHYGAPADDIHAVQLEMCQSTYMDESFPFDYRAELAGRVKPVVRNMVRAALEALAG